MPALAELQQAFAQSLLAGGPVPAAVKGCLLPDEAMSVHRNTVLGALVGALRLSHPTVDALVSEAFFDQAASTFARQHPPRTASLMGYGEGFADFLERQPACAHLPYLADVARLDFAIERALQQDDRPRTFVLDAAVTMALPCSLSLLTLRYPADAIRAAISDEAALAAITLEPAERHVVVWRQDLAARVRPVSAAAGYFLHALLAGASAQAALAQAGGDTALADIQADIFTAPFCTIIANPEGHAP